MTERYIIDANVFIQAKNFHYGFDFCQGFWDWLRAGFEQDVIFSIKKVRAELLAGTQGDSARNWALNMPTAFFLEDTGDIHVMREYAHCMQWAHQDRYYKQAALVRFAQAHRADAFLLAYARAYGHVLVTQELSQPDKRKEIPIPDAALKIGGIKTTTIYNLLRKHAKSTFVFQK